jgi:hypothetical protein
MESTGLSKKSRVVLGAMADGHTCDEILAAYPAWTYRDVSQAAAEALEVAAVVPAGKSHNDRLEEIRQSHPHAYEKWDAEEDTRLTKLFQSGLPQKEIARILQRQFGAIQNRLAKLGLAGPAAGST